MMSQVRPRTVQLLWRTSNVYVCRAQHSTVNSSLPRQPVPCLEHSMKRHLDSLRPVLSEDLFAKTNKVAQRFLKSHGPVLQHLLHKQADEQINWLTNVVYEDMLRERIPLPINWNYAITSVSQHVSDPDKQLRLAAKVTASLLDLKKKIDSNVIVERDRPEEHCKRQFRYMFSSYRIPCLKQDLPICYSSQNGAIRHINVIHNNQVFSLDVYGESGERLSREQLYEQLKAIREQSPSAGQPVGLLTALDRDTWAEVRADLLQDERNRTVLDDIQRSIFVLCLDKKVEDSIKRDSLTTADPANRDPDSQRLHAANSQIYHGSGVHLNTANRWFDKGLQMVVASDGAFGLNSEHSALDGTHAEFIMASVSRDIASSDTEDVPEEASKLTPPRKLDLHLDDKAKSAVETSGQAMTQLINNTQVKPFIFGCFGKEDIKRYGVSPDSFMQIALQLTMKRMGGSTRYAIQHAGQREFLLGRTASMIATSTDAQAFLQTMDDTSGTEVKKAVLLRHAINAHRQVYTELVKGHDVYIHLVGLMKIAEKYGYQLPDEFLDVPLLCVDENEVFLGSSGMVTAEDLMLASGSFPGSYGLWYHLDEHRIKMTVVGIHGHVRTDPAQFVKVLADSLKDLHALLDIKKQFYSYSTEF